MGRDEQFERKINYEQRERDFEKTKAFLIDSGLVEPCMDTEHEHAPGEHDTISEKGAYVWDLLSQFIGLQHLNRISIARNLQAINELHEEVETPETMH